MLFVFPPSLLWRNLSLLLHVSSSLAAVTDSPSLPPSPDPGSMHTGLRKQGVTQSWTVATSPSAARRTGSGVHGTQASAFSDPRAEAVRWL